MALANDYSWRVGTATQNNPRLPHELRAPSRVGCSDLLGKASVRSKDNNDVFMRIIWEEGAIRSIRSPLITGMARN